MSAFQSVPTWHEPGAGVKGPALWYGPNAPDGDAQPWLSAPVGSIYMQKTSNSGPRYLFEKREAQGTDTDWGAVGGIHVLQQTCTLADFTDAEDATGTLVLDEGIPAGAFALQTVLLNVADWDPTTTLTITVGDGSDVDRYNTGTPSIATDAVMIDMGAISGTEIHTTAVSTVTITLTEDDDFTDLTDGSFTIRIYYYL